MWIPHGVWAKPSFSRITKYPAGFFLRRDRPSPTTLVKMRLQQPSRSLLRGAHRDVPLYFLRNPLGICCPLCFPAPPAVANARYAIHGLQFLLWHLLWITFLRSGGNYEIQNGWGGRFSPKHLRGRPYSDLRRATLFLAVRDHWIGLYPHTAYFELRLTVSVGGP